MRRKVMACRVILGLWFSNILVKERLNVAYHSFISSLNTIMGEAVC
jgi:hypothetical protein